MPRGGGGILEPVDCDLCHGGASRSNSALSCRRRELRRSDWQP